MEVLKKAVDPETAKLMDNFENKTITVPVNMFMGLLSVGLSYLENPMYSNEQKDLVGEVVVSAMELLAKEFPKEPKS